MKDTFLKSMLIGLGLLYIGGHSALSSTNEEDKPETIRRVSKEERDAEATPKKVKEFFGKVEETKEKTQERADKSKPALKEAGKEVEQAAKDTGKAVEKAVSTLAGRRDDK